MNPKDKQKTVRTRVSYYIAQELSNWVKSLLKPGSLYRNESHVVEVALKELKDRANPPKV